MKVKVPYLKETFCRMLVRIAAAGLVLLLLLLLSLVVAVLLLELPHVFVRILHVVVADILENLLQVANWLIGDLDEILDIVVLVLLEGVEEHVHHSILVIAGLLALGLLSLPIFDLEG